MDYNTQNKKLILPEYGRNIQKMIDFTIEIEDLEERKKAVKTIIDVMGNLYPHLRDVPDFRHKLWDHLAIMSDFKMNIETPYPLPIMEEINERPEKMPYNTGRVKYKHYGKTMEKFIAKIDSIEDKETRKEYIALLANHMKKSYLMWNQDSVEDKHIIKDIKGLSPVAIDYDIRLSETKPYAPKRNVNKPIKRTENKPHRFVKRTNKN